MHAVWFWSVDCRGMRWSKGDDFEKSSHLAPFYEAPSSFLWFLDCKKNHSITLHVISKVSGPHEDIQPHRVCPVVWFSQCFSACFMFIDMEETFARVKM